MLENMIRKGRGGGDGGGYRCGHVIVNITYMSPTEDGLGRSVWIGRPTETYTHLSGLQISPHTLHPHNENSSYSAQDQAQIRQHVDQLYACVAFCANEVGPVPCCAVPCLPCVYR